MIPMYVWKWYFFKASPKLWMWSIIIHILASAIIGIQDWWVGAWAKDTYNKDNTFYTMIFFGLSVAFALGTILRIVLHSQFSAKTCFAIYNELISSVLRRPMSFFDTTPVGQILNRCGQDIENLDFLIPMCYNGFMTNILTILTSFIMICIFVPIMIVMFVIVLIFLTCYHIDYIKTSTDLRRLTLITNSPVISSCTEAISGYQTIKSYNKTDFWFSKFGKDADMNNAAFVHEAYLVKWIELRYDGFTCFLISLIMMLVMTSTYVQINSSNDENFMGIVLSNSFGITGAIPFM